MYGDITLREAVQQYKDIYMASRNFAQQTRVEYLKDIQNLISFLEKINVREVKSLTIQHLERYLAELDRRGNAGSTRKRKVISIRSFLWYLYQDGYISTNLSKRLIPPFSEANTPRYLSKSEYERLLKASSKNPRDFSLIQLLLQTGIKLSELIHLTIQDVELPKTIFQEMKSVGYLYLAGSKSKKGRIIPLNSKVCVSLANYFNKRKMISSQALFINKYGEPLSARGVEKVVHKYMLQAGIVDASVQSLRHTFGIHHIISGTNLKTVQDMLGLKDSRTISSYFLITPGKLEVQEHSL